MTIKFRENLRRKYRFVYDPDPADDLVYFERCSNCDEGKARPRNEFYYRIRGMYVQRINQRRWEWYNGHPNSQYPHMQKDREELKKLEDEYMKNASTLG